MACKTRSTSISDDSIEKLIQKVCATFANQLKADFDVRFNKLEDQLKVVSSALNTINCDIKSNKEAILNLNSQLDVTQQLSKRNSLRFVGLPEEDGERVIDTVVNFINITLNVHCSKRDIDCAFRLAKTDNAERPRVILVTFALNWIRNEVFSAKKVLKNSEVAIFEDLTKIRYDLLMHSKRKYGKSKVWSAGGNIYFWSDTENKKKIISVQI